MKIPPMSTLKKPTLIALAALVACSTALYGVVALYERHVSGDLRILLVAALDPRHSLVDQRVFLDEMRPLIHTQRDFQVLDKFQRSLSLILPAPGTTPAAPSSSDGAKSLSNSDTGSCQQTLQLLLYIEGQYRANSLKIPAELTAKVQRATVEAKGCQNRNLALPQKAEPVPPEGLREGQQLQAELRNELGLPPAEAVPAIAPAVLPVNDAQQSTQPSNVYTASQAETASSTTSVAAPSIPSESIPPALAPAPRSSSIAKVVVKREPRPRPTRVSRRNASHFQPTLVAAKSRSTKIFVAKEKPYSAGVRPSASSGQSGCPSPSSGDFEHVPAGWQFCAVSGSCLSLGETRRCFR
jgi:hypothetical protein